MQYRIINGQKKLVQGGVASQKQLDDENAKIATLQANINAQESSLHTTTSSLNEQSNTVKVQLMEINDQIKKIWLSSTRLKELY